jgi:hypothetical protein
MATSTPPYRDGLATAATAADQGICFNRQMDGNPSSYLWNVRASAKVHASLLVHIQDGQEIASSDLQVATSRKWHETTLL